MSQAEIGKGKVDKIASKTFRIVCSFLVRSKHCFFGKYISPINCIHQKNRSVFDLQNSSILYFLYFQASREFLVTYPIRNNSYGTLHTSVVGLRFEAQRQHFSPDDGDMKLKCTASIGDIYWQVNEKSAEGLKSKRASSSTNYQSFVHDGNRPPGKYVYNEQYP